MQQTWDALYNEYGKEKIEELREEVSKFLRFKLQKPWWSVSPNRIVQSEGGFHLLVLRGITYILESELSGVQSIDPKVDGLRRFSNALVAEYGNALKENHNVRFSTVDEEYIPEEEERERSASSAAAFGGLRAARLSELTLSASDPSTIFNIPSEPSTPPPDNSQINGQLELALSELTALQRDLFETYAVLDNNVKELATVTKRNYTTVNGQIYRIKQKLRKLLGPYPGGTSTPDRASLDC